MSDQAIFERAFGLFSLCMVLSAVGVIFSVRWLLRSWTAVWWKMVAIHLVNAVMMFLLAIKLGETFIFNVVAVTNGTIVNFCLGILAADGARVEVARIGSAGNRKWIRWAIFGLLILATIGWSRSTVRSPGRVPEMRLFLKGAAVLGSLQKHPLGEQVVPVLMRTFPEDGKQLVTNIARRSRSIDPDTRIRSKPTDFPVKDVMGVIVRHRSALVSAPEPELQAVRMSMTELVRWMEGVCPVPQPHDKRRLAAWSALRVSPAELRILGRMMVTLLVAERAGLDRPMRRIVSEKEQQKFVDGFKRYYRHTSENMGLDAYGKCRMAVDQLRYSTMSSIANFGTALSGRHDMLSEVFPTPAPAM